MAKVREIVVRRKKKYFSTIPNILCFLPLVGILVTIYLEEWLFSCAFLGLSFLMIGPIVKYRMAYKVIVLTSSNTQKESFFIRRKDELLVALVSALIGALISFLLIKSLGQAQ
jgi:Co/Zn/Cd efflux system component